jgi:hypothetical protein
VTIYSGSRTAPTRCSRKSHFPKPHAIALVGLWPIFGFLRRQCTCRASAARHPFEPASDLVIAGRAKVHGQKIELFEQFAEAHRAAGFAAMLKAEQLPGFEHGDFGSRFVGSRRSSFADRYRRLLFISASTSSSQISMFLV